MTTETDIEELREQLASLRSDFDATRQKPELHILSLAEVNAQLVEESEVRVLRETLARVREAVSLADDMPVNSASAVGIVERVREALGV